MLSSDDVAQALGVYLMDSGMVVDDTLEEYIIVYEQFENNTTLVTLYTKEEAEEKDLL